VPSQPRDSGRTPNWYDGDTVIHGHHVDGPDLPRPVFPPFPDLPLPYKAECDAACQKGWTDFFAPLVREGAVVKTDFGEKLARPGPDCDRDCLTEYWQLMRRASKGQPPSSERFGDDPQWAPKGAEAVEIIFDALGIGDFFDPPQESAPSPRIPQGSVIVKEGPVYLDKGSSAVPKGGPPKASGPAKGPSSGPAADDIGDWDGGNPFGFDTNAPNSVDATAQKPRGIFSLIDDLLDFAQQ
jgi:hypothetical protein